MNARVGFALAAIYSGAYLRMSTWVPFLWAAAHSEHIPCLFHSRLIMPLSSGRHHQLLLDLG